MAVELQINANAKKRMCLNNFISIWFSSVYGTLIQPYHVTLE